MGMHSVSSVCDAVIPLNTKELHFELRHLRADDSDGGKLVCLREDMSRNARCGLKTGKAARVVRRVCWPVNVVERHNCSS